MRIKLMRFWQQLFAVITCAVMAHSISAAELSSADVTLVADSNPAKAQFDRDIESANSLRAGLNVLVHSITIDELSGVDFNFRASFEFNTSIEELGESVFLGGVEYFSENETLPGSPLFVLRGELGYTDSETDIRDAGMLGITASGNWQPRPFVDFTAGARADFRFARSEVFDTTKGQFFAQANFSPASRFVLRSGLSLVFGDEVSTATPTIAIINAASSIEPDNAFGGFEAERFAYNLSATSVILELGANTEFTPQISGDIGFRYVDTRADEDIDYQRLLFTVSARYAFK